MVPQQDEGRGAWYGLHARAGDLARSCCRPGCRASSPASCWPSPRAAGESAPLLFTALFSNYWLSGLIEPTASLSILIYNFSGMPFENQIELAWTASLVLVLIVLVFNIVGRIVGRPKV